MRTLKFLLQKEFRQIFRDPAILRVIFVVPLIQLLLLPWTADYEVRNVKLAIVDKDRSTYARQLIARITSSGYFQLQLYGNSYDKAFREIEKNNADIIVEIPNHFERDLVRDNEATLFFAANAINGVKAGLGTSYLQNIVRDFNKEIRDEWIQTPRLNPEILIDVRTANWYNPLMNYKFFMVPGILVMLVTIVGSFLTSMNIVKEKEIGTIEQINVTPVKKHHFILGKLIPFWIMGLLILTIGMIIAWILYGIVPVGSLFTIYLFAAVYLLAILGYGLLISTFASSQQQAMLATFFLFMIFVLLGGLYTPIESMPLWAQWFTRVNPVTYFIEVMRLVVLKGSSLSDIAPHIGVVSIYAVVLNVWAVFSYRKRS
ncbi:MAG TPA: ABC transporter permease [Flavisolibacter sp.]|nr:ABC transporter permease [Flavisolibacter sp.]